MKTNANVHTSATEVAIQNLHIAYGNNVIYNNFSHTFDGNKVHVILGKSGCGKTTLLNAIANFVNYDGAINCGKLSYVFQQPRLAHTTVFGNVEMALLNVIKDKTERANVVQKYLNLAELAPLSDSFVTKLSGGEQQRVSLARAFAFPSDVLLMDEPFKSLDLGIRKTLYKTLDNLLTQNPRTTILVTHDVDEALALADTIYILQDRPCMLTPICQIDTPRAKRDLYSNELLNLRQTLEKLL
jgi:NitT/TauT family transport system ATP-binding protein